MEAVETYRVLLAAKNGGGFEHQIPYNNILEAESSGLINRIKEDSQRNLTNNYCLTKEGRRLFQSMKRKIKSEYGSIEEWLNLHDFPS